MDIDDKQLARPVSALLQRHRSRNAENFESAAFVNARTRDEMLERLLLISATPQVVLDLGAGGGLAEKALAKRYPRAKILSFDSNLAMLKATKPQRWRFLSRSKANAVQADPSKLPLAGDSVDLVFSNMLLPTIGTADDVFNEVARVLKPSGVFVFSTLGPDTLQELRDAWRMIDSYQHVAEFADMHDVGDALTRSGLLEPVLDIERLQVSYDKSQSLWQDLRDLGAGNSLPGRRKSLCARARFDALNDVLFANQAPLNLTIEIVYGQCWGGVRRAAGSSQGEFFISPTTIGRRD